MLFTLLGWHDNLSLFNFLQTFLANRLLNTLHLPCCLHDHLIKSTLSWSQARCRQQFSCSMPLLNQSVTA